MIESVKKEILTIWQTRETELKYPPATEAQLKTFETAFGKIPDDYRWFLLNCGGGVIGSEWVDNINELASSHKKFQKGCAIEHGWNIGHCFLIGWDASGSPIAMTPEGAVVVEWEADSGVYELAPSLEDWLLQGLTQAL